MKKVALTIASTIEIVHIPYEEINRLQAARAYCEVYTTKGKHYTICKSMASILKQLKTENYFIKTHKSYVVNIKQVDSYKKTEGSTIILKDGVAVPLAKRLKHSFRKAFEKLPLGK